MVLISALLLDPKAVLAQEGIDLLGEEHPQVERNRLFVARDTVAEVADLVTYLRCGIVSHRFGDSDIFNARL
jgi:hypothetical protein